MLNPTKILEIAQYHHKRVVSLDQFVDMVGLIEATHPSPIALDINRLIRYRMTIGFQAEINLPEDDPTLANEVRKNMAKIISSHVNGELIHQLYCLKAHIYDGDRVGALAHIDKLIKKLNE